MYYSNGNYEAFAHPEKPEGVERKSAYIVGSGLAALSAACFLVRDGQMQGERIHILEKDDLPGGACDGYKYNELGYVKSLVFAYLIMKNKSLFNKSMYISTGFEYNPNGIMQNIMHSNDKIEQRKKLGLEVESNKKSPHKRPLTHPDSDSKFMQLTKNSDMSGNIHKTKTVSSVNSIRKVKTTKRK